MRYHNIQNYHQKAHVNKCPYCGCGYTALGGISLLLGDKLLSVEKDNISLAAIESDTRGVVLQRLYNCEQGHNYVVEERFHKGETCEVTEKLPDSTKLNVLWRD